MWVPKTYARGIAVELVQLNDGIGGSARAFMDTWTDGLCRGRRVGYQRDDGSMTGANGQPKDGTVGTPRPVWEQIRRHAAHSVAGDRQHRGTR